MLHIWISLIAMLSFVNGHKQEYFIQKKIIHQQFRETPENVTTEEGNNVILRCAVDHRAGRVQWTKDDYALGYTYPQVPGFDRYLMEVDESKGIFNLKLTNVSLEDVGKYECQVGPFVNVTARSDPIRTAAMVEVMSPPVSVQIIGHTNGERINVKNQQTVTLKCLAKGSRPCAEINWRKGNSSLITYSRNDEQINSTDKKCDVHSVVSFAVTLSDDSVMYSCEASANTSTHRKRLTTTVQFNVLYAPSEPYIEGYRDGHSLHAGEMAQLICRARGGNPLAQLLWYKGSTAVQTVYNSFDDEYSENKLILHVNGADNEATYTCEATSPAILSPMKKSVKLNVYFGPDDISMFGNNEEKSGTMATVSCSTSSSNPAAIINWSVDGVSMDHAASNREISGLYGGFVTKSDVKFLIPTNKREVLVVCRAFNTQISHQVIANRTLRILHAPSKPMISGYVPGAFIIAGSFHNLTCDSTGGNPLATLIWYKNEIKIPSVTKTNGLSATSIITVPISASDNGAEYKCEASNSATSVPLRTSVQLQVYFSPANITVTVTPNKLKEGTLAKLHCNSSSSNPPAEISWWKDGVQLTDDVETSSYPGDYFGMCSRSVFSLLVTSDVNGNMFTCQAKNTVLMNTIHSGIKINVSHKPVFTSLNQTYFEVVAGELFSISLEAVANPPVLSYKWSKNGMVNVRSGSGPTLHIVNVKKSDAGNYSCIATNSEGSDVISFTLVVKHSLTITQIPEYVMAEEGSSVQFSCSVSGYPLEAGHVRWYKDDFNSWSHRATYDFINDTSYVTLSSVNQTDGGHFYCIADNGIRPAVNKSVHLVIEYAPIITTFPRKFASEIEKTVWFTCGASGAPKVEFYWTKDNLNIFKNSSKYILSTHQETYENYTSVLTINRITSDDYGYYTCVAKNIHGRANLTNELTVISQPDPPTQLTAEILPNRSIKLSWSLDFDGGNPTSFQIRYYNSHTGNNYYYKYEDVGQNVSYVVTGLEPGQNYVFDVVAFNKMGRGNFSEPLAITSSGAVRGSLVDLFDDEGLILIIAAIVGILLILLNIFLILIFVIRRSKKCEKDVVSEHSSSSKSHSVELFGSSSLNGTVSRGTLSSHSGKSVSSYEGIRNYKSNEINYRPSNNHNNSNGYLIDGLNYSSHYHNEDNDFILPHARYSDVPTYQYNTLERNLYDNIHQNGYTSLNRAHQRTAEYKDTEASWPSARNSLPLKRWEPAPSVTDSKESSPSLPPPMTTFNYNNVQERYLIV